MSIRIPARDIRTLPSGTPLAVREDGALLATSHGDGSLGMWSLSTFEKVATVRVEPDRYETRKTARAAAFLPNEEIVVSEPGALVVRDVHTLAEKRRTGADTPERIEVGGGGAWILTQTLQGKVSVYRVDTLALRSFAFDSREGHTSWPVACANRDGDTVLLGDDGGWIDSGLTDKGPLRDHELTLWDVDFRKELRKTAPHFVRAAAYDRARKRFVFATSDGTIGAWSEDGSGEDLLAEIAAETIAVTRDTCVVVRKESATIELWPPTFEGEPTSIALAPHRLLVSEDGRFMAYTADGALQVASLSSLPRSRARSTLVTRAQVRSIGHEWPASVEPVMREDRIDVDATMERLYHSIAYAERTLAEMYEFARTWKANVDDATNRREETIELRDRATAELARVRAVRDAVVAHGPIADVPDDPREALRGTLLAAVLAAPDDDAPRLAYADALGEPERAQHLRLEREAETFPEWHPGRARCLEKAAAAAWRNREAWEGELAAYGTHRFIARGFVSGIAIDPYAFVRTADAIFARAPIRKLSVSGTLGDLPKVPQLARLRSIDLHDAVDPGDLVTSEHLGELRELSIGQADDWLRHEPQRWWGEAAHAGTLRSLESLTVWKVDGVSQGLPELAGSLAKLTRLYVYRAMTPDALIALGATDLPARVRSLRLELTSEAHARALAAVAWPRLEALSLDGNLGATPLGALLPFDAPMLRTLSLHGMRIDEAACRALASASLPALRELVLESTVIDAACAQALASAPWLGALERLRVVATKLEPVALAEVIDRLGRNLRALEIASESMSGFALARRQPELELLGVGASVAPAELEGALKLAMPSLLAVAFVYGKPSSELVALLGRRGLAASRRDASHFRRGG